LVWRNIKVGGNYMDFHKYPNIFVGEVSLLVADLSRSTQFYTEVIGFKVLKQTDTATVLTADGSTPLLTIEQSGNSAPGNPRTPGLYHFALLLPERADLARALLHLLQKGYPLQGASDHLVSEALYLADPDGNGIEIYSDRPSEQWGWQNGLVEMTTERLDAEGLLAETQGRNWEGLPAGTVMGHIHLQVSNLQETEEFYCKGLGFDLVNRYGQHALFVSSGGYHHHIGLNTWNSAGAGRSIPGSIGLQYFTLILPDSEAVSIIIDRLRQIRAEIKEGHEGTVVVDPSGIHIKLEVQ
jgi:catechol 2,3-dioxygenase